MTKSYSELRRFPTFLERYRYVRLRGNVGDSTFGFERYLNQRFYRSREWRHIREHVIIRDQGCDLGIVGREIHDRPYIHHLNPMTIDDISRGDDRILDPQFLITVTHTTHNAIHYGSEESLPRLLVERRPGDTKLW